MVPPGTPRAPHERDTMSATRTERDTMGEMQVPADALYGASTARAVANFASSSGNCAAAFARHWTVGCAGPKV